MDYLHRTPIKEQTKNFTQQLKKLISIAFLGLKSRPNPQPHIPHTVQTPSKYYQVYVSDVEHIINSPFSIPLCDYDGEPEE